MSRIERFRKHVLHYEIEETAQKVWKKYRSVDPQDVFAGPVAELGIMYSTNSDETITRDSSRNFLFNVGQIYVLDLYFEYWIHLPVAFEITDTEVNGLSSDIFPFIQVRMTSGIDRFTPPITPYRLMSSIGTSRNCPVWI